MKHSLMDLKRDLRVGSCLILLERFGEETNDKKEVIMVQGNGVYFKKEGSKRGSFLEYPVASLVDYVDDDVVLYTAGYRDLTEQEQEILRNMPSMLPENATLAENDALTDGSSTYYMDKRYLNEKDANWYWGWHKGLRYSGHNNKMQDKKIKGQVELKYKFIKKGRE